MIRIFRPTVKPSGVDKWELNTETQDLKVFYIDGKSNPSYLYVSELLNMIDKKEITEETNAA